VEAAFLKHITDDPDDRLSRLVFADWLCEQDDRARNERGEFIRLQHALVEGTVPPKERPGLLARQAELLERYRDRWEESFRGLVGHCEYRNGFAERVTLSADELVHGFEELIRHAPVVRVRLRGLTAETVDAVAAAPALDRLRELDLNRAAIAPDVFRTLLGSPHLGRLRGLQLARTGVGDEGVRALVASSVFRRLKYLNLSHTDLTAAGLTTLVSAIRNRTTVLEVLVLRGAPRLSPGTLPPLPPTVPVRLRQSLQMQIGLELGPPESPLARLHASRETLSADLRRWVEWFATNKLGSFPRAVTALPLPEPVRRVFTAVCQRRLVWRAHRLGLAPPEEDRTCDDLPRLMKLLFDQAGGQQERVIEECLVNPRALKHLTRVADGREGRALADCLLELWLRHERGDLPADGKTR
jgi:uncharacterized protein (TIGR02996 family)